MSEKKAKKGFFKRLFGREESTFEPAVAADIAESEALVEAVPAVEEAVPSQREEKPAEEVAPADPVNKSAPEPEPEPELESEPVLEVVPAVPQYEPGVHYEVLAQSVPTKNADKIEVVEMFWYGCSHCYNFESKIHPWSEALPEYVDFVPTPAVWHPDMALHAKAFYTARAMNLLDTLHIKLFEALNVEKKRLNSANEIADFFEENGADRSKALAVFDSFGINQAVKMAQSRQLAYHMQGTPEMVVNGKYRISGRLAGSLENMLNIAAFLIEEEWQAKQ